jgi:hypothetical protein
LHLPNFEKPWRWWKQGFASSRNRFVCYSKTASCRVANTNILIKIYGGILVGVPDFRCLGGSGNGV